MVIIIFFKELYFGLWISLRLKTKVKLSSAHAVTSNWSQHKITPVYY